MLSSTNLNQFQRNESVVQVQLRSPGSPDSMTTSSGMWNLYREYEPIYKTIPKNGHTINISVESVDLSTAMKKRGVSTRSKWKPGTLGAILNQSKLISTKRIRRSRTTAFAWQPRCYEHIIRNDDSVSRIRTYLQHNPEK